MSTNTHMMTQHIFTHSYCVFAHTQSQEFADTDGALWPFSLISWSSFGSEKKSPLLAVQSTPQTSMVNLMKLLLAVSAVLGTPTSEENVQWSPPRQRRRKVSFADDAKDNDHTESSRRLSTSELPPKKNLAILRKDDDSSSREGGTVGSGNEIIGRDLYKDEDERAMMAEARATEKTDNNLSKILRKRTGKQREGSSLEVHAQSSRSKAEREAALADLKRRRDAASATRGSSCQCSSIEKMDLPADKVNGSNLMTLSNEEESSRNEKLSSGENKKSPKLPTRHEIMGHMPMRQELLLEKRQALEKINSSSVHSAAIVKQRVEEKRPVVWKPAMIAVEKFRLTRELELANDNDVVELKRIKGRVQELEAVRASRQRSSKKALVELAVQSTGQISMVNLEKLLLAASETLATTSTEENVQSPPRRRR